MLSAYLSKTKQNKTKQNKTKQDKKKTTITQNSVLIWSFFNGKGDFQFSLPQVEEEASSSGFVVKAVRIMEKVVKIMVKFESQV